MADITLTKAARTLVAASTSNGAGSTTRGTVDLRTALGGILTFKIANGGTGPTVGCTANILTAHNTGTTPTAASAGADWKTLHSITHPTTNSLTTEYRYEVPQGVMHLEIEFTGNTGQAVTVEAFLGEVTKAVSV